MENLHSNTTINASPEKIWDVLWEDSNYRKWTAVFSEGSRAETDWKEGSKVLFLDGSGEGMVATIAENRPYEFMSIQHLGMLKDGVEDLSSEEVSKWAGAFENYTLSNKGDETELGVDIDVTEDFKKYFMDTWPKALSKVKELAENGK